MEKVLLIEPFYGGSHRQLIDLLNKRVPGCVKVTMSPKKWHWRSRTSALHLSQTISPSDTYRVLFSSSVLNLAELVALRPDLAKLKKILYFHENQLIYPVRKNQDRDFQYGYNQIISSLVADVVVFNSAYNMESFLSSIKGFLKLMPDYRPSGLGEKIRPKCQVIHFPLHFPDQITHEVEPKEETSNSHMHQNLKHKNYGRKIDDQYDAVTPKHICLETNDGNKITHFETMENRENTNFGFCKERNLNDETVNDKGDNLGAKQGYSVERENSLVRESLSGEGRVHSTSENSSKDTCTRMDHTTSMEELIPENKFLASAESVTGEKSLMEAGLATRTSQTLVEKEQFTVEAPVSRSENTCTQTAESEAKVIQGETTTSLPLHVVWPHRWEHDKDPDTFLNTMIKLHDNGINFHLSVLGEQFTDVPEIFERAKSILGDRIVHWGHQASKEDYYRVLSDADVVVSTSLHEFFGVAMLEAVHHNCFPLCPNRLVYPEIFPECYLYNTPNQLYKTLKRFCIHPNIVRGSKVQMSIEKYLWKNIAKQFEELLETGVT